MIGLYDDYLRMKAAFEERFPDKADYFPGPSQSLADVAGFLARHMPDCNWYSARFDETPALIRNYPKGE